MPGIDLLKFFRITGEQLQKIETLELERILKRRKKVKGGEKKTMAKEKLRRDAYTFEEVRFILNGKAQGLPGSEIREGLRSEWNSERTIGAIDAVYSQYRHYKNEDQVYISPSMKEFFKKYVEQEGRHGNVHVDYDATPNESEEEEAIEEKGELEIAVNPKTSKATVKKVEKKVRSSIEIHEELVNVYTHFSTLIAEYAKAIEKETEERVRAEVGEGVSAEELERLQKYEKKYKKLIASFKEDEEE